MPDNDDSRATQDLLLLMVMHFLVDTVAGMISPLWPDIEEHTGAGSGATFWLLMIWMMSTSFSQLLFSLIGAASAGRWLLWAGPMTAAVCLGTIAIVHQPIVLGLLLGFGGLGIAAFHPEAATRAGNCWPKARSRAMSLFSTAGFLGQSAGPAISGMLVAGYGMQGLSLGTGTLLVLIVMLATGRHHGGYQWKVRHQPAEDSVWRVIRQNRRVVFLLLLTGVLRVVPASGIPVAIAYWLRQRHLGSESIGIVQSAFMSGIGLGGLIAAATASHRTERLTLSVIPMLAIPCLMQVQSLSQNGLMLAMFGAGLTLGMAQPVFISLGQQLLSASRRIGSSITMGVSWGLGGVLVAALIEYCERSQEFSTAFSVFIACTFVSSLLTLCLPAGRPD